MSKSIKYQIQPKEIDADGNEVSLSSYVFQTTYTNKANTARELLDANVYVTLPVIEDQRAVEFQSDQEVIFSILSSGTEIAEFLNCKGLILIINKDYTYRVKNMSGSTAKIVWRSYS